MFTTHFASRNRNVNGTIIEIDADHRLALAVSCWGRVKGKVQACHPPASKKDWAGSTPEFVRWDDRPYVPCEVLVAGVLNLQPGEDDFNAELDEQWPNRIRCWPQSVEVEPVVIDPDTAQAIDCPDWFTATLEAIRSNYYQEASKFRLLAGEKYQQRIATLDHPMVKVSALL